MNKMVICKPAAVLLCVVILLCACLCGCQQNEKGFPVPVSPAEVSAFELNGEGYADTQLGEIYDCMAEDNSIDKLNKKFEIKCLRKNDDGYHIVYTGVKRVLVLSFDSTGSWTDTDKLACIYTLTSSRAAFDKLSVGDSIELVKAADPECRFAFLMSGLGEPRCSDHYTEDGYHTHIEYNSDLNISDIYYDVI